MCVLSVCEVNIVALDECDYPFSANRERAHGLLLLLLFLNLTVCKKNAVGLEIELSCLTIVTWNGQWTVFSQ